MKGVSAGTSFIFFAILLLLMFAYAGTHPSAFSILAVTPPVRPQKQQSILQPNIIALGQCMTLKPCTDPDIRFSYSCTGTVTHKIAVEKAGDDRYFLIRIKHGVPPEFNHTGQSIAYFLCIHKQSRLFWPYCSRRRTERQNRIPSFRPHICATMSCIKQQAAATPRPAVPL